MLFGALQTRQIADVEPEGSFKKVLCLGMNALQRMHLGFVGVTKVLMFVKRRLLLPATRVTFGAFSFSSSEVA